MGWIKPGVEVKIISGRHHGLSARIKSEPKHSRYMPEDTPEEERLVEVYIYPIERTVRVFAKRLRPDVSVGGGSPDPNAMFKLHKRR